MKFNEKSLNSKISNIAKKLGVGDTNRVRIIVALERLVAKIINSEIS